MRIRDLGLIDYRRAWTIQEEAHARVLGGGEEEFLLLEHHPVITFGRRAADSARNLIASAQELERLGVEVVESDRGGDITFHGPGQLVAYPIVSVGRRGMSPGKYVHGLEDVVIATLKEFAVDGFKDAAAPGVWVHGREGPAKICAIGVRIRRGVSLHGVAVNFSTELRYFELINSCGLGRPVTSLQEVLPGGWPGMADLKDRLAGQMKRWLGA